MPADALGWHAQWELSRTTLLALAPLMMAILGLWAYCLRDLARAPTVRYLPKPLWALIIVFVSAPLGALAYLLVGRDRNAGSSAAAVIPQSPEKTEPARRPAGVGGRR